MKSQKNKRGAALITGAAQRIGEALALALAKDGFEIALHFHNSESSAIKVQREIKKLGRKCELFPCDLSDSTLTSLLIEQTHKKFPDLNVLINSASIFEKSTLLASDLESFERHMSINLKAPYILIKNFARICKEGNVINLLDTNIVKDKTAHFDYLLTKKALADLTKMAAVELGPKIRVNGIAPGFILPPPNLTDQRYLKEKVQQIPLKTQGNPQQITDAALFLLNNPYVTGQIIFVDGGEHLI